MSELWKRLILLAGALLVGLVLAEIVLRLFVDQETKRLAAYDLDLGWTGRPGGEGWYIRSRDGIRCHFAYNALGFRDEEVTNSSPVERRFLMMGDSFLEALEVDYPETFQKSVEERLKANGGGAADVAIIASQGYSTAQQLWAYQKFGATIASGTVVLVFYTGNDFVDNVRKDFAFLNADGVLVLPERSEPWWRIQYLKFARWMYETSHLFFFVKNSIENLTSIRLADESKKSSEESASYRFAITDSLIAHLHRKVVADGRSMLLVIIPSAREVEAGDARLVNRVMETGKRLRIPVLDLFPVLSRDHYFRYDEHLNREGHAVVADTLSSFLEGHVKSIDLL
jgi:hypothetical protein